MKRIRHIASWAALGITLAGLSVYGQETPPAADPPAGTGDQHQERLRDQMEDVRDRLEDVRDRREDRRDRREDRLDHIIRPERPERPDRPDRPPRPQLPQEIRELIAAFQTAREAYLTGQKDLLRQLANSTEEQRDQIREQLRANREKWLEEQQTRREEIRNRLRELREEFRNNRDPILDAAPERGGRRKGGG